MTDRDTSPGYGRRLSRSAGLELEDLLAEIRSRAAGAQESQERLAGLLDAVVAVSSNLDLSKVLARIIEAACTLVNAQYGALGVIDDSGQRLTEFVTHGLTEEERSRLGDPPSGHGILGLLLRDPRPRIIDDLGAHPGAVGFPPGHPPMTTFIGVPVRVRDHVFGNLYLTEKLGGGGFTEEDETVLTALAAAAGIAIENAQLYRRAQRAQAWAQAIGELTQTLLEGRHERSALARMVKRARELGDADLAVLIVPGDDEDGLIVQAVETRVPGQHSLLGRSLTSSRWPLLLAGRVPLLLMAVPGDQHSGELSAELRGGSGLPPDGATVIVPITVGPVEVGLIALVWTGEHQWEAGDVLDMLTAFGEQMGLAIEAARAQSDRSRTTLLEDRDRIARDMHDHVIQRLFATGLSLQAAARLSDGPVRDKVSAAVDELDAAVKEIRQAIFELHHPIAASGLGPEIELIVEKAAVGFGFVPDVTFDGLLSDVPFELVADVIAVVREALANSVRHAHATDAHVRVSTVGHLVITVRDNGVGTSPGAARSGLVNLAERAAARGGTFEVRDLRPSGTELVWEVPFEARPVGSRHV